MRLDLQLPEPSRFWVRYTPRSWPTSHGLWTHVGNASLGPETTGSRATSAALRSSQKTRAGEVSSLLGGETGVSAPLDDLLYLPPVRQDARDLRDRWAASHAAAGSPVMVQLKPGEAPEEGVISLYDLLESLLLERHDDFELLPAGSTVVWPLIPGVTDDPRLWRQGCDRMAAAGVARVQAQTLQLSPSQRRRLAAKAPEEAFHALFHRPSPAERHFDRIAHECGLEVFLVRPVQENFPRVASNRRLAASLALAGELWLRLERPMHQGDDLFRAARWVDTAPQDVHALAREGNLAIIEAVRGKGRDLLEQLVEGRREHLLEELRVEYLEGESP